MGRNKVRIFLLIVLSGTLLISLLLCVVLPLVAYVYFQTYGIIVPGVRVGDLELGGLTWQEAKDGLDLVYGIDPDLILTDGERNWITKASEFGLGWDTAAMAQRAQELEVAGAVLAEEGLDELDVADAAGEVARDLAAEQA